jgi:LacI family transcriptional regulator
MKASRKKHSVKDVARIADVSAGTVSRVFNRKDSVDVELQRKVCWVSREIGFKPKVNAPAISLITNIEDFGATVDYVSVMTNLLARELMLRNIGVNLTDLHDLAQIHDPHTIGVIAMVANPLIDELAAIPKLPVITLTKPMPELKFHSIRADHQQQGKLAAEYLIKNGHSRIAFLGYNPNEWSSIERLKGYLDALTEAGLAQEDLLIQYSLDNQLYDIIARWIKRGVTAIINFDFKAPLELTHILNNVLEIKIGKDVSVIGLEDFSIYHYLTPPQTTIIQPLQQIATQSIAALLDKNGIAKLAGKASLIDINLPSNLIERDSVVNLKN